MYSENELTQTELKWMEELLTECQREGVMPRHRFELAAYAIIAKGNAKKAVGKLKKLRAVEAAHNFDKIDSATAARVTDAASPGMGAASGRDRLGRPSYYMDYAAFKPKGFESEHALNCLMRSTFDNLVAMTPTIKDVREGSVWLSTAKGFGWDNFSFSLEEKMNKLYQDAFPIKVKAIYITDSSLILSAIIKVCRVFMSKKIADRIFACSTQDILSGKIGGFSPDQLPPEMGGTFSEPEQAWLERNLKRREESILELGPIE